MKVVGMIVDICDSLGYYFVNWILFRTRETNSFYYFLSFILAASNLLFHVAKTFSYALYCLSSYDFCISLGPTDFRIFLIRCFEFEIIEEANQSALTRL